MLVPAGLAPLEAAAGLAVAPAPPLALPPVSLEPMPALEASVLPVLERATPCGVAFSGGRDSSLLLAAATRAARRAGVAEPVPVTLRYPHLPETDESRWQQLVVGHLGLSEWVRVDVTDELDLLGPAAREALRAHGPLFPANAHSLVPMLDAVAGGAPLVGLGGDELLDCHRWTALNDVLARRRRPGRRDAARLAVAMAPGAARGALLAAREAERVPWLRPAAQLALLRLEAREAAEPVAFDAFVARAAADRNVALGLATLRRLGAARRVEVGAPLVDPIFVSALARSGGRHGLGGRRAAMSAIAGDALPRAVVERPGKVVFTRTFFSSATRRFAQSWSGEGLDERIVDPEAVRRAWLAPPPSFRAALLLQSAWLHDGSRAATAASAPGR